MPQKKFDGVYRDLKKKIEDGVYELRTVLPSENALAERYGCARSVIRNAMAELIKRGYVQTVKRSGARVIWRPFKQVAFMLGGIESFKEAALRNGFSYYTKVVRLEKIIADEIIADKTDFKVGDELYDVRRVRFVNDIALILDKNYFLTSVARNLTEEIASNSIYEYLENVLRIKITTSKRRMTTELATDEDRQHLELADYNCLAVVSGRVYNSDGIQFEYTESRHRPDYFCFEDTAVRRKFNG